ncbi:MAG: ComF family protein [Paraglaciecola sp.]
MALTHFAISQSCLLCRQDSLALICPFCQDDLALFDWQKYQYNLLNWPQAKRGLKNFNSLQLLALADYQWPWSSLLTGLKFSSKLPHAKILAQLFVQQLLSSPRPFPEAIVPVPLHSSRYRQRKFNQSIEIAKHMAALIPIPMDTSFISRVKATVAQTELSAAKRKANLKDAFALHHAPHYKHIVLFDDVVTTGATMNAMFGLLKRHCPALQIDVWCICLTLEH